MKITNTDILTNSNILIGNKNVSDIQYTNSHTIESIMVYFDFMSDILDLPNFETIMNMTNEERQYYIKAYKRDKKIDSILNEDR